MLYVVGAELPKTDFLTKIDQVVVISLCVMAGIATSSRLVAWMDSKYGEKVANDWDFWIEWLGLALYVVSNGWIFAPSWYTRNSNVHKLKNHTEADQKKRAPPEAATAVVDDHRAANSGQWEKLPTVRDHATFYRIQDIEGSDESRKKEEAEGAKNEATGRPRQQSAYPENSNTGGRQRAP